MRKHTRAAIILAAGQGTRMKSDLPKVMHPIAGKPMVTHVIDTCRAAAIDSICVVVAPAMEVVKQAVSPCQTAIQEKPMGTGDAARAARSVLGDYDGFVFILYGDVPFVRAETLENLYEKAQKTGLAVLGFEAKNPHGYGRLLIQDTHVTAIVEEKDCTDDQRRITLCNGGLYCVRGDRLFPWLDQLTNNNAQGEYYLTDIVSIAARDGVSCAYAVTDEAEVLGVNSRAQLAEAEAIMQGHLRSRAMAKGVTMIDPKTVYLSVDTDFAHDIVIEPNVFFGPGVRVGKGTVIHAFSHIEGADIGENTSIGPFARIRPHSKIGDGATAGNFIEVNRSEMKPGSKSKHLSYLGDAVIGEKANIGAGTVIANYDGYQKQITTIGKKAFVGSNSTIIAPVTIGEGAITAAGSVITDDVPDDAMAVGRARQTNLDGRAKQYHAEKKT